MSTKQRCIKCNDTLKREDYGVFWGFTDDGRPYHKFKCLYPGQEWIIVYED